jgi:hypothetical protein
MSHNTIKVNAQEPSATGGVTQALADLSDVSGPFENNQTLGYSSGWTGLNPPAIARIPIVSFESHTTYNATYYYDLNDNVIWRNAQTVILDSTYASRVTASGSLVPTSNANWTQYYILKSSTLQGKTILCEAVHFGKNLTGSEYIKYQWGVGSSNLSTFTPIGNIAEQNQLYTSTALGIYTVGASNINLALKVVGLSGSISMMDASRANYCSLQISILD